MNKEQIIRNYISASIAQDTKTSTFVDQIDAIFNAFSNYEPLSVEYSNMIDSMFVKIVGADNAEWVYWYLWDRPMLTNSANNVKIDDVWYDIDSVDALIKYCIKI